MKRYKSFFAGVLAMLSVLTLTGTALAASGRLQISSAGLVIMDEEKIKPGDSYLVDGYRIPAAVAYTGTDGKPYYYLPAQMMSDYFNVRLGWSEEQNSVVLGALASGTASRPKGPNPTKPTLGARVGPYKEVAAKTVDTKRQPSLICDDKTHVQTVTGIHGGGSFLATNGKYAVLRVTNNGKERITCLAGQPALLGEPTYFPAVDIEPGNTLTRAFELDGGTPKENDELLFEILGAAGTSGQVDATFSLMQFE